MTKSMKNILIIVAVLIIAGLGYTFWPKDMIDDGQNTNNQSPTEQMQQNKQIIDNQELEIEIAQGEPKVITSDIDTSNWKTYRNEELGFELKYPREWEYRGNGYQYYQFSPAPVATPSNDVGFFIYKKNMNIENKNVSDLYVIKKLIQMLETKIKPKVLNKIMLNDNLVFVAGLRVYFIDNNKDLFITNFIPGSEIPENIYNGILLSFKTIEKNNL